jgi:peptidoglycan hydrolase-like protein with peptidoglycan-binding domain
MQPSFRKPLLLVSISTLILSGAVAAQEKDVTAARTAVGPKNAPVKTITNFSQALRCMDEMLLAYDKRGIVITSGGIPDETGKVRTGTKEMLLTAIARMSTRSNAFDFIDLTRADESLAWMSELKQGVTKIPDYYIRGSITQMDDNAVRKTKGWGISLPFLDFGSSEDQAFDLISMDMSVGEAASRRILPETSTSNTMVIRKGGNSKEGGGKLGKIGLSFNMDLSATEGVGATTRTLLELSLIEAIGKFTRVPYWKCLDVDSTNPLMMDQAREWYDTAKDADRVLFFQRKLSGMNRYKGPLDGKMSENLKNAIAEYQAAVNLIADGRINFDLYYSLLDDMQNKLAELPVAPARRESSPMLSGAPQPAPEPAGAAPAGGAFRLALSSERGEKPAYRVGEFLNLTLSASRTGTAYCYYEDAQHNVARIFPNQFYPNSMVAGTLVRLPAGGFKIKFDRPGRERVACIAADREIVTPGKFTGTPDLRPLAVKSVDEVVAQFKQVNPAASVSFVEITVQ